MSMMEATAAAGAKKKQKVWSLDDALAGVEEEEDDGAHGFGLLAKQEEEDEQALLESQLLVMEGFEATKMRLMYGDLVKGAGGGGVTQQQEQAIRSRLGQDAIAVHLCARSARICGIKDSSKKAKKFAAKLGKTSATMASRSSTGSSKKGAAKKTKSSGDDLVDKKKIPFLKCGKDGSILFGQGYLVEKAAARAAMSFGGAESSVSQVASQPESSTTSSHQQTQQPKPSHGYDPTHFASFPKSSLHDPIASSVLLNAKIACAAFMIGKQSTVFTSTAIPVVPKKEHVDVGVGSSDFKDEVENELKPIPILSPSSSTLSEQSSSSLSTMEDEKIHLVVSDFVCTSSNRVLLEALIKVMQETIKYSEVKVVCSSNVAYLRQSYAYVTGLVNDADFDSPYGGGGGKKKSSETTSDFDSPCEKEHMDLLMSIWLLHRYRVANKLLPLDIVDHMGFGSEHVDKQRFGVLGKTLEELVSSIQLEYAASKLSALEILSQPSPVCNTYY